MVFSSSNAQRYAKKQFTNFSYTVNIDEKFRQNLSRVESLVQLNVDSKQNKIDALLIHSLYKVVTRVFTDTLEFFILPPNSLTDKAKYNIYGYPDITIQKAIRLSDTKYFIKIHAYLENEIFDKDNKRYPEGIFKPKVRIVTELYNKDGFNPIEVSEGISTTSAPIDVTQGFVAGLEFIDSNVKAEAGSKTLYSMFYDASLQSAWGIKYKQKK